MPEGVLVTNTALALSLLLATQPAHQHFTNLMRSQMHPAQHWD